MKIRSLAFDSLGTRSMATYVETKDVKILIDPGVALAPERFGLPPHKKEIERMDEHWETIKRYAKKSDVLIITHYHFDHHDPEHPEVYKDKILYTKHPKENINMSQTKRSKRFLERIAGQPKEINYSDGKEYVHGKTALRFSPAMSHGLHARLGYVTMVVVDDGKKRFIHTSDVLGPCTKAQTDYIIKEDPHVLLTDGALNFTLREANENLVRIIKECASLRTLIVDHHLLRDVKWRERIEPAFSAAKEKGIDLLCAAEYAGKKIEQLEARRKELYAKKQS